MAFDYDHLLNYQIPSDEDELTADSAIIYALGIGMGAQPSDEKQLSYLYELHEGGLQVAPMMANVIGYPGFWMKREDTGVDWPRVLHGEQAFTIRKPFQVGTTYRGESRVKAIYDKGTDKGAIVLTERSITDVASGDEVCVIVQSNFCRGDGGCGGPGGSAPKPHQVPEREPDQTCDLRVLPQAALLYRLCGDRNPLHADPAVARSAGFDAPILHGLCTLGHAGHAILKSVCDYDGSRIADMRLRFSSPVYPGETLRTAIWIDGNTVSFRTSVVERDIIVLSNGCVTLV